MKIKILILNNKIRELMMIINITKISIKINFNRKKVIVIKMKDKFIKNK